MRHSFAKKVLLLYSVLSVTVCNSRCDARKEYCTLHYDRIRKPTNISFVGAGALLDQREALQEYAQDG